jgi:hypothetical protein
MASFADTRASWDTPDRARSWQVPDYLTATPKEVTIWAMQQVDDGREFFEKSPGYEQLEESVRLLSGAPDAKLQAKQKDGKYSKLYTSRLKRNLREQIASLSDIRFVPGFKSDNTDFQKQESTLNKYAAFWYVDRFIDISIKKGVQWMGITPCAWLEIKYHQIPGERGKSEIEVDGLSAFDVVMSGVPDNGDHQRAYAVTIIKDMPIYLAHATWPEHQRQLKPDRETPKGWFEKMRDKTRAIIADIFTIPSNIPSTAKNPTVRLYYQYVLDLSVNSSGKEVRMGYVKRMRKVVENGVPIDREVEIETPWAYKVPFVGQMIPAGYDAGGTMTYRVAQEEDCRLFPGRRLIVFNELKDRIYDGPMWDWHGKVPLVKLCADPWPFGDFSMVHDTAPIQVTINELERMAHQTARNRYNPSMLYNYRAVDRNKAKVFRTDVTGQRLGYNGAEGTGDNIMRPALPKEFYGIEEWYMKFLDTYLPQNMDYQMGVRQIQGLSQMKATIKDDSLSSALENSGPIVKSIARDMERAMRDLAEMFKFLVIQYKRTPALLAVLGVDGVSAENFDYQPGNLIPSHLPGENKDKPSIYTDRERAKWLADHIPFFVAPNTLHEIVQMSQKMIYLQLWRSPQPFPIDPWTIAEVLRLGNFGPMPEGANNMLERWTKWQEIQLRIKMKMAAEAKILARELGLDDQGMDGGGGGPGGGTPKGGARGRGGRAPSGQAAPQIVSKDGGARSTIKESS